MQGKLWGTMEMIPMRFLFYFTLLIFLTNITTAQYKKKGEAFSAKYLNGAPSAAKLNINNVSTWFYNNGSSDITAGGDCGFQYPFGTGKTIFFQSGPLWGGCIDGYWAVGGSAYRSGLRPGRIMPDGSAEDPNSNIVRIYRVRSDYKNFSTAGEKKNLFANEIADEGKTADEIFAQYDLDWKQWPAQFGAPFIDKDKNGIYNPDIDVPGMSENRCQTIWFVANDMDASATQLLYGALPMQLELQGTFWTVKGNKPEGNTIYRRYKLINRNTKKIDSMYFCMWSDPDLGAPFDDLVGCDSALNLGFVYNGQPTDDFYGATPPAAGFVILQSPYVPGTPQDKADFDFRSLAGYKNLGMTCFFMFSSGIESDWSDPVGGNYAGTKSYINLFKGRLSRSGTPVRDYVTGKRTMFMLSGDPVKRTGWVDGVLHAKNDRRFGMVSGEFSMNPNDTQQIITAQLAAGGDGKLDYLNAVASLKFYAKSIANGWKDDLTLLQPNSPSVQVSELNEKIILNWWAPASIAKCEADLSNTYKFQGYNVYQLPKASSALSDSKLLTVYDKIDNLSVVYGWIEDPVTGYIEYRAIGFGNNSGIKRYYEITRDLIGYNKPLYNYSKYYFGVTSFYAADDPEKVPRLIESPLQIITTSPQPENPGDRFTIGKGDELNIVHTAGNGDGFILAFMIDPAKGDGNEYTIKFPTESTYTIYKGADAIFSDMPIKGEENDSPIVAGAQIYINFLSTYVLKNADRSRGNNPWDQNSYMNWPYGSISQGLWNGSLLSGNYWFYNGVSGKGNGSSLSQRSQYHKVIIKFADTDINGNFSENDVNASFGYRFMENADKSPAKQEFTPFIKNQLNFGFQEFGLNGKPNVPLAVYDQETGKRLTVGFLESNNSYGLVDGKYWPAKYAYPVGSNYTHEVLFIFADEYSAIMNSNYSQTDREIYNNSKYGPLPFMYFISSSRSADKFSSGDEVTIDVNNPFTLIDKFTFTVPAVTNSTDLAKEDVDKINVFPNPYYGVNQQEGNSYQRFVTFTHLPAKATVKIFNVSGQLVRILAKDDNTQTLRWNLATDSNLYIASGIYIARIDMPDLGKVKTLKFAVIVEQQYPVHY